MLNGHMLDLEFFYKGGEGVVEITEVLVRDIWGNFFLGETAPGSITQEPTYKLSLVSNPPDIGAVLTGAGDYPVDYLVSVAASEPLNYRFRQWTNSVSMSGIPADPAASSSSFSMKKFDLVLTAHYDKIHQDPVFLNLSFVDHGEVHIGGKAYSSSGGKQTLVFNRGDVVTLEAVVPDGSFFHSWEADQQYIDRKITLVMGGDRSATAIFSRALPLLVLNVEGKGAVFVHGQEKTEGSHTLCYRQTTPVSTTFRASNGWSFIRWESDLFHSGESHKLVENITVYPGLQTVTALFEKTPIPPEKLTMNIVGGGQVLVDGAPYTGELSYLPGTQITLEAQPDSNWAFDGWAGAPAALALLDDPFARQAAFTMPEHAVSLTAQYIRLYDVTFMVNMLYVDGLHHALTFDKEKDVIKLTGDLFSWKRTGEVPATPELTPMHDDPNTYGITLQLPAGSYSYLYVLVDGGENAEWTGLPERSFIVTNHDLVLSDWFGSLAEPERKYVIVIKHGPNGSASPSGEVVVSRHESLTLQFTPDEGYHVAELWVDGKSVSPADTLRLKEIQDHHTIQVVFAINIYTVTLSSTEGGGFSGATELTVHHGGELTVQIVPDTGYHIQDVLLDSVSMGDVDEIHLADMKGDHHIHVVFAINMYTITISHNEHGSVDPGDELQVQYGGDVRFSITPDPGYHIEEVLVNGERFGNTAELLLHDIQEDMHIQVSFALTTYSLSFEIRDASSGQVITDAVITFDGVQHPAGEYQIQDVAPGTYFYTVTSDGYFPVTESVTIAGADHTVSLTLHIDNTSVSEAAVQEIKMWPVPARDVLWVEFNSQESFAAVIIEVYNLQGRLMKQFAVQETGFVQQGLNIQDLTPGVYVLQIKGSRPFSARQFMVR